MHAQSGATIETVNPFNESPIAQVAAAGSADVDVAVAAARAAFRGGSAWRSLSSAARGALLYKLAELVERDQHVLATIDAWDNGKPYQVSGQSIQL